MKIDSSLIESIRIPIFIPGDEVAHIMDATLEIAPPEQTLASYFH
jgi:hypothetical protein